MRGAHLVASIQYTPPQITTRVWGWNSEEAGASNLNLKLICGGV